MAVLKQNNVKLVWNLTLWIKEEKSVSSAPVWMEKRNDQTLPVVKNVPVINYRTDNDWSFRNIGYRNR